MDSSIVIAVVTALAALIGAASPIIVSLIQSNKDKSEKPSGIYVPSSYVLHRPKKQIRWYVVLFFAILSGAIGYTGAKFASTKTNPPTEPPSATPTIPSVSETPDPALTYLAQPYESITGVWSGTDEGTVGGNPVSGREVEVTILGDCSIGNICGTTTTLVNDELCYKNMILIEVKNDTFIFEGQVKEGSGSFCGEGGLITLKPLQDGTLLYGLDSINSEGKQVKKSAILNLR